MKTPNIETQPANTPTPWTSEVPPSSCLTSRHIIGPNREPVASVGLPQGYSCGTFADVANAALIVRAVNAHAELVKALERAIEQIDFTVRAMTLGRTVSVSSLQNCAAYARASVAKAKGQP